MTAAAIRLGIEPRPHQRLIHALRLVTRFLVVVWHRGAGKTVWACLELVVAALACKRADGRYAYIAPFLNSAKDIAWSYLKGLARAIPGVEINEAELRITLPNGASLRVYGADHPDSLRGRHFDGVIMDEVKDMRPEVWGEIIRPALTQRQGWCVFIGTAKGINLFSQLYYRAMAGEEGWKASVLRASESGLLTPEELDRARREMTEAQFAAEMECDFAAAVENALVPLQAVLDAQRRKVAPGWVDGDPVILGVDVARYGGDRSVAVVRQGVVCFEPKVWRGMDLMELSGRVALMIDDAKPDATFVDEGGLGAGVVDRLRQLGYPVLGVNFGGRPMDARFANRRAEMWWLMAEWVKTACLPATPELIPDLTAPTYTYANAAGKLALESKDDMRERGLPSPDIADALALTFAEPVMARGLAAYRATSPRSMARVEYDPYASEASA